MYEWDHVHTKALKTKSDSIYNPCQSLKNHVTKVMQENKLNCHKAINSLCPSDPKKMWHEIKESNRNFINDPDDFFMVRPKNYQGV